MSAIQQIIEKASKLNGTIVLPEGMDARVITAACACVDRKICTPVVLGTAEEIAAAEAKAGLKLPERGIKTIDYTVRSGAVDTKATANYVTRDDFDRIEKEIDDIKKSLGKEKK